MNFCLLVSGAQNTINIQLTQFFLNDQWVQLLSTEGVEKISADDSAPNTGFPRLIRTSTCAVRTFCIALPHLVPHLTSLLYGLDYLELLSRLATSIESFPDGIKHRAEM